MREIAEDTFRFNSLGLLAILIALLLFGLRVASRRIENQYILTFVFILSIGCFITIGIVIYDIEEQKKHPKKKLNESGYKVQEPIDTVVQMSNFETTTYISEPDTTKLTCDFMRGEWKVVSTDDNTSINTNVRFECQSSNKKVSIKTEECRLKVHPISEYSLSNFEGGCSSSTLYLERDGSRIKGLLKTPIIGTLKTNYERTFPEKKEKLVTYKLLFTKKY